MPEHTAEPMQTDKRKFSLMRDLQEGILAENDEILEAERKGLKRGPVTGFESLDETLGGFLRNGVHMVQAAPGDGKTAFCLQVAANCGFPALYVTAEMPPDELIRRSISRVTNEYLGHFGKGMSREKLLNLFDRTARACPWLAFLDSTRDFIPAEDIQNSAELLLTQSEHRKILLVLDSITDWARSTESGGTEYEQIAYGIRAMGRIAHNLKIPVLAINHRNRASNKEGGGSMFGGKGGGDIEYKGESLIELKAEGKPDEDGHTKTTLSILKNRHGRSKLDFPLLFEGRVQKFTEEGG